MSADLESLHNTLKHPIRRKIVLALHEKKELTYMDLMNLVEVDNTGKLNYHLKILNDLIEKNGNGRYHLTDKGQLAAELLQRFPEKKAESTSLRAGDAALIGFAGFLVTLANPGFWGFFVVGALGFPTLNYVYLFYSLLVPGGLMWLLTVRRTNSHDAYDLFKPPFVTFIFFVILSVLMIIFHVTITVMFPTTDSTYITMTQPTLPAVIIFWLAFPFLGVEISEIISKTIKKIKS